MKRNPIVIICILFSALVLAGVADDCFAGEQPAPRISFPETVHDFGTISRGDNVTHVFKVQNTGDAPLRLIKAKGS